MKIINRHVIFGNPTETDEEIIQDLERMDREEAKERKEAREIERDIKEERRYRPSKKARKLHIKAT